MVKSIFSPITINQMTLRNRLVVPPMVTNYGTEKGEVTDRLITYLEARARGGFGLITLEATAVHPGGRGFQKQVGLWDDSQIPGLADLAAAIHRHGARLSVQLFHAGRQTYSAVLGTQSVSASAVPCPVCKEVPRELNLSGIKEIVRSFAKAAERARIAGADALEIHGAHGYLVNQFVSPYSNRRVDEYGGSLKNRMRFPLEVIAEVRKAVGADFPVIYRISARERVPGGLTLEENLVIARILSEAGIDAFHVSTGVYGSMPYIIPPYSLPEGLNVEDAHAIREATGLPVIVAGRITEVFMAESIVSTGKADMVAMGRASIVDPDLPRKAAAGAFDDIRPCISCNQGCIGGLLGPAMEMSCLVNPTVGKEKEFAVTPAPVKKKVMVVGAGPAGLEAARILAQRGHSVVLSDKSDRFGGQFRLAALPPEKQPLAKLIRWQADQAAKAGVTVKLGNEVTRQVVTDARPDTVVVATGGKPLIPRIPGADAPWVASAWDVLAGKAPTGQNVLIMGGGSVGCETADYLLHLEKRVTIVEMLGELARDVESTTRYFLLQRLNNLGANVVLNATIVEITRDGVIYERQGQRQELRGFDTLVAAFGTAPENSLVKDILGIVTEVYVIGDAEEPRRAIDAIRDAEKLATRI
ncbi:MAG: FAD-dependent oxidoreductase [Candidatus Fermentithermobacillus carboniphilus]|uniref:FAD-dependent oxidoreductase n=1 Tax=Candidatus Fermentithermobacillus carboniphilus TaxID=3085328 RepID=A0AAT9LDB2_9FIRM|nr:MAG: FAD-dependent oxidoreductase [Candidatus Fermentithermobacillus carboniphilus]